MSTAPSPRTPVRALRPRTWPRWVAIIAVLLIPLAFVAAFAGSFSDSEEGLDRIPAAIVNNDEMVTQTAEDGTETMVLAGRLLVTQLTATDNELFDWTITNSEEAAEKLAAGEVYAVLTVPEDFSSSIVSLSSDSPQKADLTVDTDDSHSYLAGTITQIAGAGMVSAFGNQLTEQYIAGIFGSLGGVGTSLTEAADGATQLQDGATSLSSGLSDLATGADSTQSGAASLTGGIAEYTAGVQSLSSGLNTFADKSAPLKQFAAGIPQYTAAVGNADDLLAPVVAKLMQGQPLTQDDVTALATASGTLDALDKQEAQLNAGAAGVSATVDGIADTAAGAAQLAAGGPSLTSGASSLTSGIGQLADGADSAASGAGKLADGVGTLATGLSDGAAAVPSYTEEEITTTSEVASDPVDLTVTRNNEVDSLGQIISTFFIPIGLWIGALAIFLIMQPVTRGLLASSASNGRILFRALGKVGLIGLGQVALLVALLHLAFGVGWELLPATALMSLIISASFLAVHTLLTLAFGRAGLLISLFLLAVQLTATGGLYPVELVAEPFQAISPFLPLGYAVTGMQNIITQGSISQVIGSAVILLIFALISVLLSLAIIARRRSARALGMVPAFS